ncbi:MAG: hypothetical protein KKB09_02050 [Nanoarchaeota archaeon]|nr:hypothetical protein [Nanoarchaeota archaeon]
MALSIIGVVLAVLGVGMASGKKIKLPSNSILDSIGKGIGVVAKVSTAIEGASNVLEKDFFSPEQLEAYKLAKEKYDLASNDSDFATAKTAELLMGREKLDNLLNWAEVSGYEVPITYRNFEAIRSASKMRYSHGKYPGSSSLSPLQAETIYRTVKYAEAYGLDTDNIKVSISNKLSNKTERGILKTVNDKHYVFISDQLTLADPEETGEHEIAHIVNPTASEAEIHKYLLDERLTDVTKNYGKLIAQLSLLDEYSKNPGTYEENGVTKKYTDLVDDFKSISSKGKTFLEDAKYQKLFESYRINKKFSGTT